ncbi:hypothetical protein VIBNISO65_680039 [Vibrio nigripulchritudo SO65]|nr:hypothetical protein VIBNIFTn2_1340044 [Vibrio nigripulchritudo FTn2]CCN66124.1 hypothetical protein VIBNIPon4_50040 [Vibrio nigripulchritudo POn4]CCN78614.1 hypothetical protein VIBNISO65_680039 [Vibrio nigripulchritudo SO65]
MIHHESRTYLNNLTTVRFTHTHPSHLGMVFNPWETVAIKENSNCTEARLF